MKNTKSVFIATACGVIVASSIAAYAALPPKYLSIKGVEACLGKEQQGTMIAVCLPPSKPKGCAKSSWKKLLSLKGADAVPPCMLLK